MNVRGPELGIPLSPLNRLLRQAAVAPLRATSFLVMEELKGARRDLEQIPDEARHLKKVVVPGRKCCFRCSQRLGAAIRRHAVVFAGRFSTILFSHGDGSIGSTQASKYTPCQGPGRSIRRCPLTPHRDPQLRKCKGSGAETETRPRIDRSVKRPSLPAPRGTSANRARPSAQVRSQRTARWRRAGRAPAPRPRYLARRTWPYDPPPWPTPR